MKSEADIKRTIRDTVAERNARQNPDAKDFLLRNKLLSFNHEQDKASLIYEITLKEILISCYPQLFDVSGGQFQVNAALEDSKASMIYAAFGLKPPGAGQSVSEFKISREKFDFKQFDLLFAEDKNPLWLVLKQAIPLHTKSSSVPLGKSSSHMLIDDRIEYQNVDQVANYLQLAEAFKAGKSTQAGQSLYRFSSVVASVLPRAVKKGGAALGLSNGAIVPTIKTPGPDKAMRAVVSMASKAIDCAKGDEHSLALVRESLMPAKDWSVLETIQDTLVPRALAQNLQSVIMPDLPPEMDANRPDNIGDWIIKNAPIYCPPGDDIKARFYGKLGELSLTQPMSQEAMAQEAMAHAYSQHEVEFSLEGSYDKENVDLQRIIDRYASSNAGSSEDQRRTVAVAVKDYLAGDNQNWFDVCELKKANPDWHTPEAISSFFAKSKLAKAVEKIEAQETGAALMSTFHKKLPLFQSHLSQKDMTALTDCASGGPAVSPMKLTLMKQTLVNKKQPELAELVEAVSSHMKNTPINHAKVAKGR